MERICGPTPNHVACMEGQELLSPVREEVPLGDARNSRTNVNVKRCYSMTAQAKMAKCLVKVKEATLAKSFYILSN